jgi:hypothetical protein
MSLSWSVRVPGYPLIDDEALLELLRLVVVFDGDVFLLVDFVAADSFRPPVWTVDLCRQRDSARTAALSFSLRKFNSSGSGYSQL